MSFQPELDEAGYIIVGSPVNPEAEKAANDVFQGVAVSNGSVKVNDGVRISPGKLVSREMMNEGELQNFVPDLEF